MASFFNLLLSLAAASLSITVFIFFQQRKQRKLQYPPGPRPLPLIGNMLDMPSKDAARVFIEWGKKHNSDILYASALGNNVFVMNKLKDAVEIFERRSRVYSDREKIPLVKMMGWDRNIGLNQYGDTWRIHRKICQQNFNQRAAVEHHPIIRSKVHGLLQALLKTPEHFEEHTKTFSTSIPLSAMYGYEAESLNDPWVELADKSLLMGAALLTPAGSLINIFPFLRHIPSWFPGASSRKTADEVKRLTEWLIESPLDWVKKKMADGTYTPSLVSKHLEGSGGKAATKEEETIISDIAFSIYVGGSDTAKSLTRTFVYLMATHPEVQQKAQMEIDSVTGGARLPDFEDRPFMPYMEAMYRELMRWMPPLHIGLPHYSTEDDMYQGYFIPKGTTIIGNIWAMTHDEEVYPEPDLFKPERFFNEDGTLNDDDTVLAYGFGRRICVGKHVASSIVWMMMTSLIASFHIGKARDELGLEIEIKDDFIDYGILTHKKPFECSFKPRSDVATELITEKTNV